jgi:hypothetical protein
MAVTIPKTNYYETSKIIIIPTDAAGADVWPGSGTRLCRL